MVRLCLLLGCVVLLGACREKAPEEGALRVSVKYGSFKPACVRVEVQDAQGHTGATDIPASQFKERETREVLVAVLRKAEWDRELSVTVSSLASATDGRCDGAVLERIASKPIPVPPKAFARHDVTLEAVDEDGDGAPVNVLWAEGTDCNDDDPRFRPESKEEECSGTDDFNCNTLTGCREPSCRAAACDDGNLCTVGDHCEGSGVEAKCLGTARQCNATSSCTLAVCDQATGDCRSSPVPSGTSCVDADMCTVQDTCNGDGTCVSGTPTPCPSPQKCFLAATSGCTANNTCNYPPDPAQVGDGCQTPSGTFTGMCRKGDGVCSSFPYRPSNFDPDTVAPADIVALTTTNNVTFNSDTLTWTPVSAVMNPGQLKPRAIPQAGGALEAVLLPVSSVNLAGTLSLVGTRPVILAVYGDAVLDEDILAHGHFNASNTVPGAGGNHPQCGTATGLNGVAAFGEGGGGGGGGNGTVGAEGGTGYSAGAELGAGGAVQDAALMPLIGGCAGGVGGGTGDMAGGKGGAGGGAFQLSVARALTLGKALSASGGGGSGGLAKRNVGGGGGGGGGSGGRVLVEALRVTLTNTAQLTANGGGGGEGGTAASNGADNGLNGTSGTLDTDAPANGGNGASMSGGNGGAGGAGETPPGKGANGTPHNGAEGGGGGGGGAVGFIHLRALQGCTTSVGYVISPPATGGCQPI